MFESLVNALFGCSHRRLSFPQTPIRRNGFPAPSEHGTYVTCLECGKELAYNWQEMRVGKPVVDARPTAEAQPEFFGKIG
jgi:hypothetical protein